MWSKNLKPRKVSHKQKNLTTYCYTCFEAMRQALIKRRVPHGSQCSSWPDSLQVGRLSTVLIEYVPFAGQEGVVLIYTGTKSDQLTTVLEVPPFSIAQRFLPSCMHFRFAKHEFVCAVWRVLKKFGMEIDRSTAMIVTTIMISMSVNPFRFKVSLLPAKFRKAKTSKTYTTFLNSASHTYRHPQTLEALRNYSRYYFSRSPPR